MKVVSLFARPLDRALALALAALVIAVISAVQLRVNWAMQGFEASFAGLLGGELAEWGSWALFVPLMVAVERRAGFQRGPVPRALAVHLGLAAGLFLAQNALLVAFTKLVDPAAHEQSYLSAYLVRALFKLPTALVVYGVILTVYWVGRLLMTQHRQAVESARLATELAEAQLRNLKTQLHPHFLFNSLHTVAGLVREGDRETAVDTLAELSDLLRRALRDGEVQEVPLREEIDFLDRYLRIQKLRFADRLEVVREIDPDTLTALVPSLLLQPLVENAVRHGLSLDREVGRVAIRARRSGPDLLLSVEDNGVGVRLEEMREGLGLGTARRRIEHLYGAAQSLTIRPLQPSGTRVEIRIPHHAAPDPAAPSGDGRPATSHA